MIPMNNPLAFLIETSVKATALLLVAGALSLAMRRASAASRYLIWQIAIAAVLGVTIGSAVVTPRWPILPQVLTVRGTNESGDNPGRPHRIGVAPATTPSSPSIGESRTRPSPSVTDPGSGSVRRDSPLASSRGQWLPSIAPEFALAIWLAGALFVVLRFAVGGLAAQWMKRDATPVHPESWAQLNDTLSLAIGLSHPVVVMKSERATTPMTFGVFTPIVLLPADADEWSAERRRVVLLHELAHVRRLDCFTNFVATVGCGLYWFNPLIWIAARRMRAECECACDDWVLRAGVKASTYADHLLDLVHTLGRAATPATALPMAQRSTFEGRLLAILEPDMRRDAVRRSRAALFVAAVVAIVLPLSAMTAPTATQSVAGASSSSTSSSPLAEAPAAAQTAPAFASEPLSRLGGALSAEAQSTTRTAPAANSDDRIQHPMAGQQLDTSVISALVAATGDADASVRLAAIKTLGESGDPRAIAALATALHSDRDPAVRRAAAWALGNIGDARGIPALGAALTGDNSVDVRRVAVWALGEIGNKAAAAAVVAALSDSDIEVRKQAVWALGEMGDRESAPAIERMLNDKNAAVREQAVWALGELGARDSGPALVRLLHDTSATVRNQVVWALGEINDKSTVDDLASVLRTDADDRVREMASWALGELDDQSAVPALAGSLNDAADNVRQMSAWALGEISPRAAPRSLVDALTDPSVEVRRDAIWALGQIADPSSAAALRQAVHDGDADVKRGALRALARIGDSSAYSVLADMLKDPDPAVRRDAAAALSGRSSGWSEPRPRPRPQPRPQPRPNGW